MSNCFVWKEPLDPGEQFVMCSEDVVFAHAGLDPSGVPSVWFETRPGQPQIEAPVYVIPTGGLVPYNCRHIGLFIIDGLVFHAYVDSWR